MIECLSQYIDQLFRETERMYKRKMGTSIEICRTSLDVFQGVEGFTFIDLRVRVDGSYLSTAHCLDPKWTLERHAWEIGEKIGKKVVQRRVIY